MGRLNEKIVADHSKMRRPMAERVRRGACLLNAAQYDEAIAELGMGVETAFDSDPLRAYLATCSSKSSGVGAGVPTISGLRGAIATDPENPALHFQLGALLVNAGRLDEAELRFTQVLSISRDHVEALVCLALAHQLRGDLRQGISLLQRAQVLRPGDALIALFLARAARECKKKGTAVDLCAVITND